MPHRDTFARPELQATVPGQLEGVDESTWLDVIQKMDEVYSRLIEDEVALEEKNAELEQAYRELKTTHDTLKLTQQQLLHSEKMASLGQLVAGVAHELNNPISFVLGNTHALQKYCMRLQSYLSAVHAQEPTEALQQMRQSLRIDHLLNDLPSLIEGTLEGAQRTSDIVHGLKRFSAMDTEEMAPLNLVPVIERAIHWVQKGAATPIKVHWAPVDDVQILGNGGQLQQVLMNLLQNAFDAINSAYEGQVWVDLQIQSKEAWVTVRDNGAGIAPGHLARVFDPFFTTKPVGQGTGLGLSISYGIVEQHSGELSARNHAPCGAVFTLKLPRLMP
jgi:two-component system sensor histidine kinase HupT/HoxJ